MSWDLGGKQLEVRPGRRAGAPHVGLVAGSREPCRGLSKGVTWSVLSCRKTTQLPHGEWAGGETLEPVAIIQVMGPRRGRRSISSAL